MNEDIKMDAVSKFELDKLFNEKMEMRKDTVNEKEALAKMIKESLGQDIKNASVEQEEKIKEVKQGFFEKLAKCLL